MKKSTKKVIAIILGLTFIIGSTFTALAANGVFLSQGRFEYFNDGSTTPDIVIDTSDLNTIYEEVSTGRGGIATAVNNTGYGKYDGVDYTANDSFISLKEAVANQFKMPTNGGSSDTYYKTSEGGLTTDKTLAADYDSENDTATELTLSSASADNLSAGTMAWDANGNLLIGSGGDNINYRELGFNEGVTQTTMLLKDLTFDIYIPVSGDGGTTGGLSVSYRNGGTTWAPSNGTTRGAWAYNAPYITFKITSAVVTISNINDYTVDILINKETGEVDGKTDPGSHDDRGTVHLVTRFKDGEVTQSGGASQSYQGMSWSTGTVSWSNVNTYNP